MPKSCKIASSVDVPKGMKRVEYAKHGYLYVWVSETELTPIKNPYDIIPAYVKVVESNGEYIIENKG